jgi:hypothetical protein
MRACVAATLVLLFAVPSSPAADPQPAPEREKVKMDEKTKAAVGKALKWMKDQQAADGSWGNTAITAFALLAYMANGHVPNQGEYGPEVAKGTRYLLACARDDGYLVGPRGGNMYCHGMAALALTQVYGMTGDQEVKKILKKSIDLIVKTQNTEGGWRYDPSPTGADISVTIMQVMALRGAKDSGIHVPDRCMTEAVKYINRCRDARSGGYRYQPYSAGPGYARTAAGVCVLQLCGDYEAEDIKKAVEYMERTGEDRQHFWYGHYYAAHALNQVGGKVWEAYYDRMKKDLLFEQKPDGRWYSSHREAAYGPVYQTAIAVLILSVPTHYLPIYQK